MFTLLALSIATITTSLYAEDMRGVKQMIQADFDQHVIRLELTESQILKAKQLFLTYQLERIEVDLALKKVKRWTEGHQPSSDHANNRDISLASNATIDQAYVQWGVIIRDLEDVYFAGLKALAPDKEEIMESLKRSRVRQSMLDEDHIKKWAPYGTNLDLIAELKGITIDNEDIKQVLMEYEYSMQNALEKLDKAFVIRQQDNTPAIDAMKNAVKQFGVEGARAEIDTLAKDWSQASLALSRIRSLNERTTEKILTILSVDAADHFRDKIYPELYPFLFKESQPIILCNRLLNLKDLAIEQNNALQSLHSEFLIRRDRELKTLAVKYRQLIGKDSILSRNRSSAMGWATRDPALPKKSTQAIAFENALNKWRAIEASFRTQMLSVLTAKQRKRVQ